MAYLRGSKKSSKPEKFTLIKDLTPLTDEGPGRYSYINHDPKYNKFIRNRYIPPPESGMTAPEWMHPEQNYGPEPVYAEQNYQPSYGEIRYPYHMANMENYQHHPGKMGSTERTLYIIAIVVLAVICILLLKKVLNV